MTEAADILRRYQAGEVFDSEYTFTFEHSKKTGMGVKSVELFDALTEEERIEFAEKISDFPILYIYDRAFIYIPYFEVWFREDPEVDEQYFHYSIEKESYIIDLDNERVYCDITRMLKTNSID